MTRLSKYTLQEPPLGRGGYGTVYKAYDEVLKVERAIKVLHPQLAADPEFIGRFRQEAQVAARLEHPHIVPVYDLGEDQGRFFLVMKLMPGGSLKELLEKEGGLPFKHALEILKQIANALDFAYNQSEKLIHRDIKPGNILFEKDGSARLADFGFAKALASTSSASISLSGELLGTPAYMAPELWEGKAPTPVVDVYSLACVFYEMITGEALFAGASPLEIMRRQALEEPQFPDEWPDGVPSSTSAVLHQALAKSPQARYLVASDFAANLKNISTDAQVRDEATEQIQPEADAEQTASQMVAPQTKAPEPRERRQPTKERPVTASSSKQKALLFLWIALAAVGVILLCFGTWFVGSKLIFSGDSEPAAILVDTPKMTMLATTSATATPLPVLAGTAIPWPQRAISDENAASFAQLARWGKGSINQVVWSPNQDLLAVASSIGIYIYDSTTLQNVRFIDTSTWVKSVVFSPDGGMLASIGEGIRLWRVSDGALIAIFEEHTAGVNSVVFSPDGNTLASGSNDGYVRLWQVDLAQSRAEGDASRLVTIKGRHTADVNIVAFSPNGDILASGSDDGTVRLWRVSDGALLNTIHAVGVLSVAFSPDGSILASGAGAGAGDETLRLWRVSDGTLLYTLEGHKSDNVNSVAFSSDGSTLASSGASEKTIKLWRVRDGALLYTLDGHFEWVRSVTFSPDGNTLASADAKTIRLWRVSDGILLDSIEGHTDGIDVVAFSPDGSMLASGSLDGIVQLWQASDGILLKSLEGHSKRVSSLAYSPDGNILASGSFDGYVRLWQISDGILLDTFDIINANTHVAFSPDGSALAFRASYRTVGLSRLSDGALLNILDQEQHNWISCIAFSPDGSTLVSGSGDDNTIRLWQVSDGTLLNTLEGHTDWVSSVSFSPDGSTLASASGDGTVRLWRASDGALLNILEGHTGSIVSVSFSPDGSTLASGSGDNAVLLWRVSDGVLLTTLRGHTGWVSSVSFSSDGDTLASGSGDGTIRIWGISPEK